MAPPAGSGEPSEVIYGLHAVREVLRSGARPLVRLLVVRQDRQFADLIRLARSAGVPVHLDGARIWNAAAASTSSLNRC